MTKSELIVRIVAKQQQLTSKDVALAANVILDHMSHTLACGNRVEFRGFGSFTSHYRPPRKAYNPKTGGTFQLEGRHVIRFKPAKMLKQQVNDAMNNKAVHDDDS